MTAYVIANIEVRDPARYADYIKLTPGTIAPGERAGTLRNPNGTSVAS